MVLGMTRSAIISGGASTGYEEALVSIIMQVR